MYDVQDSFHYDYKVNISSPILVSIAGGQTRISDFDAYIYLNQYQLQVNEICEREKKRVRESESSHLCTPQCFMSCEWEEINKCLCCLCMYMNRPSRGEAPQVDIIYSGFDVICVVCRVWREISRDCQMYQHEQWQRALWMGENQWKRSPIKPKEGGLHKTLYLFPWYESWSIS